MADCLRSLNYEFNFLQISLSRISPALHLEDAKFNPCIRLRIYSALSLMLSEVLGVSFDKIWQQGFLPKMDVYTYLWSAHFRASNDDPACNSSLSVTFRFLQLISFYMPYVVSGIHFRT